LKLLETVWVLMFTSKRTLDEHDLDDEKNKIKILN
jgi:hypothetical protein